MARRKRTRLSDLPPEQQGHWQALIRATAEQAIARMDAALALLDAQKDCLERKALVYAAHRKTRRNKA